MNARAGRIAALVVLGAWGLYILVANTILWGPLRGWLDTKPDSMNVEYANAWTVIPGRVVVDRFSLRFQDKNVQFLLGLDRITMQIDLFALARRRFHVTHLTAEGATFRFRHKLDSPAEADARIAAFPPIPGYADPPVKSEDDKTPKPPVSDEDYKTWAIALDEVAASVRDLWVFEYRYRGPGGVAGGFHLRPQRELGVTPSIFVSNGGVLSIGERDLMVRASGRVHAKVDPFDVRGPQGLEVLHQIDTTVDLTGDLVSLEPFGATYLAGTGVALERGDGALTIHARAVKGILETDTTARYSSSDVVVTTGRARIGASVVANAQVENGALTSDAAIERATVAASGATTPALTFEKSTMHVDLGNVDLAGTFRLAALAGAVASVKAPDLAAVAPLAPPGVTLRGGAITASGKASYRDDAIDARFDATFTRARGGLGPVELDATGKTWFALKSTALTAGLTLRSSSIAIKGAKADNVWIDTKVEGKASLAALDAAITLRAGPGDRVLRLGSGLVSIPVFASDAAAGPELAASARVRVHRDDASLELKGAKDGAVESRGAIAKAKDRVRGAFLVSAGFVRVGVELEDGTTSVVPAAGPDWLAPRTERDLLLATTNRHTD